MIPSAKPKFFYKLFGMAVRSEIEFPEFTLMTPAEQAITTQPWIDVVYEAIAETLVDSFRVASWIESTKTQCLYHVADKCRILVSDGNRLAVDLHVDVALSDVRPYLTTCGFATLAFQNQFIPLHVSAVDTPKGVWLFTGPSGAGKSTTSVALSKFTGWPLLGDDLAVLVFNDDDQDASIGSVHFGVNKVKLWDNAAQLLGIDGEGLERDFFRPHKYHVPVQAGRHDVAMTDVAGITTLVWDKAVANSSTRKASKAEVYASLMNAIYPTYLAPLYLDMAVLRTRLLRLAAMLDGMTLIRPETDPDLKQTIDALVCGIVD